jgi:HAD superfamily phosphatase (TIGR01668 family)
MAIFKSNLILRRITEITPEMVKSLGIKALLLDVDNTLSTHHGTILVEGLPEWLEIMKQNGIKTVVVSNSKRFRIEPFAGRINQPFVSLACKPLPFGYAKGRKMAGVKKKECAIVGDQIFTDVLGANLYGIKSILVRPVKLEDGWSFKVRRYFEKKLLKEKF